MKTCSLRIVRGDEREPNISQGVKKLQGNPSQSLAPNEEYGSKIGRNVYATTNGSYIQSKTFKL